MKKQSERSPWIVASIARSWIDVEHAMAMTVRDETIAYLGL
jgi:hypothetical protein